MKGINPNTGSYWAKPDKLEDIIRKVQRENENSHSWGLAWQSIIAQALRAEGYIHRSEILLPEKKPEIMCIGNESIPNLKGIGSNEAIGEVRKMNNMEVRDG